MTSARSMHGLRGVGVAVAAVALSGGLCVPAQADSVRPSNPSGTDASASIAFEQSDQDALVWAGRALNLADFNEDGTTDVVLLDRNKLARFAGHGDGTLARVGKPTGKGSFKSSKYLIVADLDADGDPDLIRSSANHNQLRILLGQPDFRFGPATKLRVRTAIRPMAADLDADGDIDVVVQDASHSTLVLFENDGAGNLTAARGPLRVEGSFNDTLAIADVDSDGLPDLVGNYGQEDTRVALNLGNWRFKALAPQSLGANREGLTLADLDADGNVDLVGTRQVEAYGDQGVVVAHGRGDGTFEDSKFYVLGHRTTRPLHVADIDGDGRLDIVAEDLGARVLRQNAQGTFDLTIHLPGLRLDVAVADMDGDSKPDLVTTDDTEASTPYLRVFRNVSHPTP